MLMSTMIYANERIVDGLQRNALNNYATVCVTWNVGRGETMCLKYNI